MSSLRRPPGPRGRTLLGVTPLTSGNSLRSLTEWSETYGDIYHCRFLRYHVYFLNRPEYIEQMLVAQNSKFIKDARCRPTASSLAMVC